MSNHAATTTASASLLGTVHTLYENLTRPQPGQRPRPPWSCLDDEGREIRFHVLRNGDAVDAEGQSAPSVDSLVELYEDFGFADRAQGTPPVGADAIRAWLDSLLAGHSVVARHGAAVVGHVALVPDGDRHELAIYVHPEYQRAGIGRTLLRTGLASAAAHDVCTVWLCVESHRRNLIQLYRDAGFTRDAEHGSTVRMSREL